MKRATRLYVGLLATWFFLHLLFRDRVWWLALISIFAPYLFIPSVALIPLVGIKFLYGQN